MNRPTGLLDTLTEQVSSSKCPGRCVHTLASLMCDDVIEAREPENEPLCPDSLRCCVDRPPPPGPIMRRPPYNDQRPPPYNGGQRPPPHYFEGGRPPHMGNLDCL